MATEDPCRAHSSYKPFIAYVWGQIYLDSDKEKPGQSDHFPEGT